MPVKRAAFKYEERERGIGTMGTKKWLGFFLIAAMLMVTVLGACSAPSSGSAPAAAPAKAAAPAAAPAKEAAPAKAAPQEVIQLTHGSLFPETHMYGKASKDWEAKIEKETGGRVKFKDFWAASLYTNPNWLQEMKKGTADVGDGVAAYVPAGLELHKALTQQFYDLSDWKTSIRVYNEVSATVPEMAAELADVKILALRGAYGTTQIISKKKVSTLQDIKGLRLRVPSDFVEWLKALGGEPVTMSPAESYQAIEKGIIDGVVLPYESLKSFKFGEVAKYVYEVNLGAFPGPHQHMNLNTWNKLPADIQKVFMDNTEYWPEMADKYQKGLDQEGLDFGKQQGVEIVKPSKEDAAKFYSVIGATVAKAGAAADAKGLPGTKLVTTTRSLIDKYNKK